jgi:hypothetical protein
MKFITRYEQFELLCKSTKKWGLYLGFDGCDTFAQVQVAAPYIDFDTWINDANVCLFNSEEEMDEYFQQTICDEVEHGIFALTCNPDGQLLNENT